MVRKKFYRVHCCLPHYSINVIRYPLFKNYKASHCNRLKKKIKNHPNKKSITCYYIIKPIRLLVLSKPAFR